MERAATRTRYSPSPSNAKRARITAEADQEVAKVKGVIRREAYSKRPVRHEYRLTQMGRDLWPAVIALKQWGDRWLGEGPAPVEIVHRVCGHVTEPRMTCSACGEPMAAHDAEPRLSEPFQTERHATRKQS